MGKLLDRLKATAGESGFRNALGRWRQDVSKTVEQLQLGANSNGILWKPGTVSNPPCSVATWAEVMTAFNRCPAGVFNVYVDTSMGPAIVPPGTYPLGGRLAFVGAHINVLPMSVSVQLQDGAVLQNLHGVDTLLTLDGNQTVAPSLTFTPGFANLQLRDGVVLRNFGAVPMIQVTAGNVLGIGLWDNSFLQVGGPAPIIHIQDGGVVALNAFDRGELATPDTISGTALATLVYQFDDTFRPNAQPNFFGTLQQDFLSRAEFEFYDDTASLPPTLGSSTVQSAIDQLKPKSGSTASRPGSPYVGQFYLDTDLGPKPIWWTGAAWIDATGAVV